MQTDIYERTSSAKLGDHRGRPRVYLQGRWLLRADFAPGRLIAARFEAGRVRLTLSEDGERRVSSKGKGETPVIDINSRELREALGGVSELTIHATSGEIVITPSRTAEKRARRVQNGLEGALFAGAGFLSEAARQAGYQPAFAVEVNERYAELYERNHPTAKMFNMSIAEVPLAELPSVELLTIGVPCEPFSVKRRNARGEAPEAHDLGDMIFWALRIVDALNPSTVLVEEVPAFLRSGAGWILLHALERMGYHVAARVVDSHDHGALTRRKRAVIVATTGAPFEWPEPAVSEATLADVLVDENEAEWFTRAEKPWLFRHWERQRAKGNNFDNQKFEASSRVVGAVSKRYFSQQGDGPVVRHPTRPDTFRWFTVDEVRRLHGVPSTYEIGETKTLAGEVLGQAVVVSTFRKILASARRGAS